MLFTAQCSLWLQEWQDELQQKAMENLQLNIPIGIDMLLGQGAHITPQALINLNQQTFTQMAEAAV